MRDHTNKLQARTDRIHASVRMVGCVAIAAIVLGLSTAAKAAAPDLVTGYEAGSSTSYSFISPAFDVPLSEHGDLLIKPSLHYLKYQTQENGLGTSVRSPGASFGMSYRYHDPKFTLDVGPSIEFVREDRDPPAGHPSADNKVGFAVGANAFYQADRSSTLSLITNYSRTSRYFFSRAGLKTRVSNRDYKGPVGVAFGPEITFQAGPGVQQYGAGAMAEIGLDRTGTSLQFRGGYTQSDFTGGIRDSHPYIGAGLYHRF